MHRQDELHRLHSVQPELRRLSNVRESTAELETTEAAPTTAATPESSPANSTTTDETENEPGPPARKPILRAKWIAADPHGPLVAEHFQHEASRGLLSRLMDRRAFKPLFALIVQSIQSQAF